MSFGEIEFLICLKSDVTEWVRSPRLTLPYLSVKTNKTPQIKPYLHSPVVSARRPAQLLFDALSHSNKRYVLFATHFSPPLPSKHWNSDKARSEGTLGKSQREVVYECLIEQATIICSFLLRAIKHSYYPEFSSSSGKNILKQY